MCSIRSSSENIQDVSFIVPIYLQTYINEDLGTGIYNNTQLKAQNKVLVLLYNCITVLLW